MGGGRRRDGYLRGGGCIHNSLSEFSQSYLFSHQGITRKDEVKLGMLEEAIG